MQSNMFILRRFIYLVFVRIWTTTFQLCLKIVTIQNIFSTRRKSHPDVFYQKTVWKIIGKITVTKLCLKKYRFKCCNLIEICFVTVVIRWLFRKFSKQFSFRIPRNACFRTFYEAFHFFIIGNWKHLQFLCKYDLFLQSWHCHYLFQLIPSSNF